MAETPALLDASGRAIPATAIQRIREGGRNGRMRALNGGSGGAWFPYDAAQVSPQEYGDWFPTPRSPDIEINPYRDRVVGRSRDLFRNDTWGRGAIFRILDSTIGGTYRLVSKPDYRALSFYGKAFDAVWADEFRRAVEARWRTFAEDVDNWSDVSQGLSIAQMWRVALAHKLVDGEGLIVGQWRPDRIGAGAATYATCFQGIDPDRLSNPYQQPDTRYLRGGVELDDDMAPLAYHIRRAHQFDPYNGVASNEWERIERRDPDGWRRVFHDHDLDRFEQHRGVSVFQPAIGRLKMLSKFYGVKLAAETVATHFGLYVTSPFDVEMVAKGLEAADGDHGDDIAGGFGWYQDMRSDFHKNRDLSIGNGVKVASLAPGESIETVKSSGTTGEFSPFTHEMLRSFAACLGMSSEEVHNDYSEASWSSARAGIVQAEKTYRRRENDFQANTATPMFSTWLAEPFDRKELPLPRGAPSYPEMKTAYSRCRWLGAPRGWVDPVAERQGAVLGLDAGFSTLEEENARQGLDWEETLEQRAIEYHRMQQLGLPHPQWFGNDQSASQAAEKPEKPSAARGRQPLQ